MSSKMIRWRGIPTLAWIALIAGAGVLIEGLSPRAAWGQVEVFVTNYLGDSVTTYSRTVRGFRTPLRSITGLSAPAGVAVDTVNNEILVANINSIAVYSLAASGNDAPLRTISGDASKLAQPIGLAVDTVNNEILVANSDSITVYSRTADGDVDPLRTIKGTGLLNPAGLAVDTGNNEILVANIGSVEANSSSIAVYGRTADGDHVAPLRTIRGAATGLAQPIGLAVDTANNEILVANSNSITVYGRTAIGDVAPLRVLSGGSTQLDHPLGLGMDSLNNQMLVANFDSNAVTVYDRTASGNAAPLRVIEGPATALQGPAFPAVAATCPSVFDFDFSDVDLSANAYSRCFRDLLGGSEITVGPDLGGTGYRSVNVQGVSGSTPTTWLTVYDATLASPAEGPPSGVQTFCADVQIVPFNNIKGAGVVAMLNEGPGQKGLALALYEAGNTDTMFLATVDLAKKGKLKTLVSVPLQDGINRKKNWYRVIMTVDPTIPKVTGRVFKHSASTNPNSPLGDQIGATLKYRPEVLPAGLTSPGKTGILASSIGAVLNVSVTNFSNNAALCAQ
jgi:DNA-binding beta-propeller fold protein YncE